MTYFKSLLKFEQILFFTFILSLFTQVGKHFWPGWSLISGIRVDYLSPTVYLSDLLVMGLGVVWVVEKFRARSLSATRRMRGIPLIPLFLLLITQLFIVLSIPSHVYGVLKLSECIFIALFVKDHISQLLKPFLYALALGSVFSACLALAQFIHQASFQSVFYLVGERLFSASTIGIATMRIGDTVRVRPYAAFPHPNVLAFALIVSNVYLLSLFTYLKQKYLVGVSLIVIQAGILVTFSRVLILLYICWLAYFMFKNVQGKWIWFGGVAIGLFSFGYGLLYRDRFVDLLARPRDFFFRVESIQSAFEIIQSHWLIGTGLNNYFSYLIGVQKNFSPVFLQPPHNVFVLVLLQTGILGLILFVTFVAQTFGQLLSRSQKSRGLDKTLIQATIVVLVIALFAGLTDHFFLTVQQGQLLMAVLIGIAWNNKVYG